MSSYQRQRYLTVNGFHVALKELSGMTLSKPKIYEGLSNGTIRGFQVGAHWRIPVEEIDDYPDRLLAESKGIPTGRQDLLGTPKTLNG
jgi:excisionase family DNA binding protein